MNRLHRNIITSETIETEEPLKPPMLDALRNWSKNTLVALTTKLAARTRSKPRSTRAEDAVKYRYRKSFYFNLKYKLKEQIGSGGYGYVYRAKNRFTGKQVAIKFIERGTLLENRPKVPLEVQILAMTHHRNTVHMIEYYKTKDYVVVVLELFGTRWTVENPTLKNNEPALNKQSTITILDTDIDSRNPEEATNDLFDCVNYHSGLKIDTAKQVFGQVVLAIDHLHKNHIVHMDIKEEVP